MAETEKAEAMRLLRECHAMLRAMSAPHPTSAPAADLDGPHGDPTIRAKSPRDWTGDEMLGRRFSECPPDYLDLLAARFEFFNTKETDEKKRSYNTRDAARARGWAARLRAGWTAPKAAGDWAPEELPKW
jgi:hypothetical protein